MGAAIGEALSFAVGVALSPLAIILVVLLLSSPRGRGAAVAFLAGWVAALGTLGAIALLLASAEEASSEGGPARWVSIAKLILGALLLVEAARSSRERLRETAEPGLPAWMDSIEEFNPRKAAATAVLFAAVKPKNLILVLGASAAIAQTGASAGAQAFALAVFVAIASIGVAAPHAIRLLAGDRAAAILVALRDWMTRENATIIAVICLVIGVSLIGDGIAGLGS